MEPRQFWVVSRSCFAQLHACRSSLKIALMLREMLDDQTLSCLHSSSHRIFQRFLGSENLTESGLKFSGSKLSPSHSIRSLCSS